LVLGWLFGGDEDKVSAKIEAHTETFPESDGLVVTLYIGGNTCPECWFAITFPVVEKEDGTPEARLFILGISKNSKRRAKKRAEEFLKAQGLSKEEIKTVMSSVIVTRLNPGAVHLFRMKKTGRPGVPLGL